MHRGQETAKGAQRICFHVGKVASDQHQDEEEEEEGEEVEEEEVEEGWSCAAPLMFAFV